MDIFDRIGGIKTVIDNIKDGFVTLLDYLNPFSDNFILKMAVIPRAGFLEEYVNELKSIFDIRFRLIYDALDYVKFLIDYNVSEGGEPPVYEITMPAKYGGDTFSVVDFSYFSNYRTYILNFIRFIAWFMFIKRIIKKFPLIIY